MTPAEDTQGISVLMSTTEDGTMISDDDFQILEDHETTEEDVMQSDATLFIPGDIINQVTNTEEPLRLVVTTFRVPTLFQSEEIAEVNQNQSEFSLVVNSYIISASLGGKIVEDLQTPIRLTFTPLNEVYCWLPS